MNPKTIADAILGFVITFGTAAIALLAGDGVAGIGDVSQASWLAAFLGALVAAAKTVQSRLAEPAPANRQAGFARPSLLLALGLASMLFVSLQGCTLMPETPRQAIAASYVTVESLAETADVAHRDGVIDDQQRAVIKADLQTAKNALDEARKIEKAGGDPQDRLEYVRKILVAVQSLLPREVPANE